MDLKEKAIVSKSNTICRARYSQNTIWTGRLIALVASCVNKNDEDFREYKFNISEIVTSYGNSYNIIREAVKESFKHFINIKNDNGIESFYNIFSKCELSSIDNSISISFHPDLKSHFLNLKNNFTQYKLIEYMKLPSIYSQRIFEILKSYDNLEYIDILITDLYTMINIPKSLKIYQNFKTRILEKSYKDINKKTSLKFTWEPIKTKNKVTAIRFIFETPKEKIKIKQQINHITEQKTNTSQFNPDYNSAVNCLIAHPTTCTPHIDYAPDVCAVCPRYIQNQKN